MLVEPDCNSAMPDDVRKPGGEDTHERKVAKDDDDDDDDVLVHRATFRGGADLSISTRGVV